MNPVLYLLMRNDIPSMNPGKLAAQAAHVANAFEHAFNKSGFAKKNLGKLYKAWKDQTSYGFGTTICLGANRDYIKGLDLNPFCQTKIMGGRVYDPTYPCEIPVEVAEYLMNENNTIVGISNGKGLFLRNELVGVYLFGEKDDPEIFSRVFELELYP